MALEDYKGVFIFAQQVDNEISNIALELLGKARDLANDLDEKTVTAVLIGSDVKGLTDKLAAYGADRVLFGTDYPLWTPESEIERFMQLGLTESEREDILWGNAARLFGISR